MGNRAAKVSEERKEEDDEDSKEKEIVISSPSSTHEEVRAGCVYGMGNGTKGQLGSQGTTCSPPQIIADGDLDSQCVVAVSGGHHMSAALTDEGYVYVWGASGLSKESLHETSEEIEAREEVDHMIILSGKDSGETKHDRKLSKSVPRRVIMPSSHIRISCVSAAGKHVLAVSTDGHIFSWGEGKNGTLGHGNRRDVNIPMGIKYLEPHFIANCSTGVQHSACVTLDGSVFLWGFGLYGQLGTSERKDSLLPRMCKFLSPQKTAETASLELVETRCVTVACGRAHTLVIYGNGDVYSIGRGTYGELGHGDQEDCLIPKLIQELSSYRIRAVAAAGSHSFAVTDVGALYAWGRSGIHGVTGLLRTAYAESDTTCVSDTEREFLDRDASIVVIPKRVPIVGSGGRQVPIRFVSTSDEGHTLLLDEQGRVWGFGYNGFGQLMVPSELSPGHPSLSSPDPYPSWKQPRLVPGLPENRRALHICAASLHSLIVVAYTRNALNRRHDEQNHALAQEYYHERERERRRREEKRLMEEERDILEQERDLMKRRIEDEFKKRKNKDILALDENETSKDREFEEQKEKLLKRRKTVRRIGGRRRRRRRRRRKKRDLFGGFGEDGGEDGDDENLLYDNEGNILRTRSIREFFGSPRSSSLPQPSTKKDDDDGGGVNL